MKDKISKPGFRTFALILAVLTGLFLFAVLLPAEKSVPALSSSTGEEEKFTVVLDAGHGYPDGGAVANDGTQESDLNLAIALKLKEILEFSGFQVILTRTDENCIGNDATTDTIRSLKVADMKARLAIMNEHPNAVFVSIHMNAMGSNKGAQVFYSPNHENSKILANLIQTNIVSLIDADNHRVEKQSQEEIYLMKNAVLPAVIVECGFITNEAELANLKDDAYQTKMAYAIFAGILQYTAENEA